MMQLFNGKIYPRFYEMDDDNIAELTLENYEKHEADWMGKNAWCVAKEFQNRIDGAPIFSEFIDCYVTKESDEAFFFNKATLKVYQWQAGMKKKEIHGYYYITKITDFMEKHYNVGEFYGVYKRWV